MHICRGLGAPQRGPRARAQLAQWLIRLWTGLQFAQMLGFPVLMSTPFVMTYNNQMRRDNTYMGAFLASVAPSATAEFLLALLWPHMLKFEEYIAAGRSRLYRILDKGIEMSYQYRASDADAR